MWHPRPQGLRFGIPHPASPRGWGMDAPGTQGGGEGRVCKLHLSPSTSADEHRTGPPTISDLWDVASVQIPLRWFTTIGRRTKSKQICSRRLVP